jgi:ATP-dependent exoDNAse (exonuclease V) beta subunit
MAGPLHDAVEVHREIPFVVTSGDFLLRGRIDLLLRKNDGSWHVIDHKTGSFDGGSGRKKLEDYAFQMLVYQKAVESLIHEPVVASLYLVDEDKIVTPDLREASERIARFMNTKPTI